MRKPPAQVQRGPKSWKQRYNDLLDFARASRIVSVLGGKLSETPDGMILRIGSYAEGGLVYPWDAIDTASESGATLQILPGYINGDTATGMTIDARYEIAITNGSTLTWLEITTEEPSMSITGIELMEGSALPENTGTVFHWPLHSFTCADDKISNLRQLEFTNLYYLNANGVHVPGSY